MIYYSKFNEKQARLISNEIAIVQEVKYEMKRKEITRIIETHEVMLDRMTAVSNRVGYGKLLLVLLLGLWIYFMFAWDFSLGLAAGGGAGVIFLVVLWVYHYRIHEKIRYSKGIIGIGKRYMARISGEWVEFRDIGEEFIDSEHPYSSDLDIVGKKSFFQFLNTTHTWHGRQAFAKDLLEGRFSKEELILRQEAVGELSGDVGFTVHMEQVFSEIGVHKSAERLVDSLQDDDAFVDGKRLRFLMMFAPVVTIILVVAALLFGIGELYLAAVAALAMQGLGWVLGMGKAHMYLEPISRLPYKLEPYSNVMEELQGQEFESAKLRELKKQMDASQAIKELSRIADKVNVRHNALIWFVVNVLLLWDFWCGFLFEKWRGRYAHLAAGWFQALGEFESLLCFSVLPNVCSTTSLPTIAPGKEIIAKEVGHPLIISDSRVSNDIVCKDNIFIISGSNMSGKTTFMRTVGINLVLAQAGSYICGREMSFSPVRIITSMRIADDLNEGISTFYAELKRIKGIISLGEARPDMMFFIDEIFRGTNSVDRLSGAKAVLGRLNALGVIGIITTHDLDLCDIADIYPRIENYSFSEGYNDGRISFDYKIRQGRSTTTNAKYLMEMVGI